MLYRDQYTKYEDIRNKLDSESCEQKNIKVESELISNDEINRFLFHLIKTNEIESEKSGVYKNDKSENNTDDIQNHNEEKENFKKILSSFRNEILIVQKAWITSNQRINDLINIIEIQENELKKLREEKINNISKTDNEKIDLLDKRITLIENLRNTTSESDLISNKPQFYMNKKYFSNKK
ncbi:MAG: hypothetical protein ACRDCG_02680 [Mycoplasmoidaceae bacterium]